MDIKDIKFLLDAVAKSGTSEFSLETPDYKVTIKRGGQVVAVTPPSLVPQTIHQAPLAPQPVSTLPAIETPKAVNPQASSASDLIDITAPIVGTFYVSPSPEAPAYVKVGDKVERGKVLCIIEAMKLMNEIEAEISGTIVEILVKNEEPVEYGQVLFRVSPDK
jgi:acetyl-CoA carboxylase biotin carboxyl carrier protein